jgi:hypothetical protein
LHSSSIRSTNLYSFHSSNSIDQKKVLCKPYLGVVVVERRRWRRRKPAKTVAVAQEVHGADGGGGDLLEEGGIDGGSGDRWSRERWGLREFWDEKRNDTERVTIYKFENISRGSDLKLLLIVLESGPKRFWFQTADDEYIISSGSKLEPLLIN